jgi:hypothetical protein
MPQVPRLVLAQVFAHFAKQKFKLSQWRSLVPCMAQVPKLANRDAKQSKDCRHGRAQVIAIQIGKGDKVVCGRTLAPVW